MLVVASALSGYDIEATDGIIGTVSDFLFDDRSWELSWLIVDNGTWLTERRLLLHPTVIGTPTYERRALTVALSKAQILGSSDIRHENPISPETGLSLYDYYGASPLWEGQGYFGGGAIASPLSSPPLYSHTELTSPNGDYPHPDDRDPHLRSITSVRGCHIHAVDGMIGHVENLLIDDHLWCISYFIVETRNFWPGEHVLISPHAVTEIDWIHDEIRLNLSCETVRRSPAWRPTEIVDAALETRLQAHYNWPMNSLY
jgi:hypothetical protein